MDYNVKLELIMTESPITLSDESTIEQAVQILDEHGFHHLPIIDKSRALVGIISRSDIDKLRSGISIFKRDNEELDEAIFRSAVTRYIMTHPVTTLHVDDHIKDAYEIFKKNKIRAIPILRDDKLCGMVTPLDIISYFLENE